MASTWPAKLGARPKSAPVKGHLPSSMVSERPASAYLGLIAVAFAAAMNLGWAEVAHAGPQTLREGLFGDRPAPGRHAADWRPPGSSRRTGRRSPGFALQESQPCGRGAARPGARSIRAASRRVGTAGVRYRGAWVLPVGGGVTIRRPACHGFRDWATPALAHSKGGCGSGCQSRGNTLPRALRACTHLLLAHTAGLARGSTPSPPWGRGWG